MMISNAERREVAARLRSLDDVRIAGKIALNGTWVFADVLDEALFGKRKFKPQKHKFGDITSRIADLIESSMNCGHDGRLYEIVAYLAEIQGKSVLVLSGDQGVPDAIKCDGGFYEKADRDALLALADELDTCTIDRLNHLGEADRISGREYAQRIREELGVSDA